MEWRTELNAMNSIWSDAQETPINSCAQNCQVAVEEGSQTVDFEAVENFFFVWQIIILSANVSTCETFREVCVRVAVQAGGSSDALRMFQLYWIRFIG